MLKAGTLTFTTIVPLTPEDTMLFFNMGPTQYYVLAPLSICLANPEHKTKCFPGTFTHEKHSKQ
jgi:hypothetical protein